MRTGRPPFTPEKVEALQELYLSLLRAGQTEDEIDAVDGMCSWPTRFAWLDNEEFSIRRLDAQRKGIEGRFADWERKANEVYQKAWDDAASPQLIGILKELGHHVRWKASKLNKEIYGDKLDVTSKDKELKGTVIVVAREDDKELLEKL